MAARTVPLPFALSEDDIPALVMAAAALNMLVVAVMTHVTSDAGASLTFGVSPFQLVALLVAMRLSLGAGENLRPSPIWLDAVVLALVLVPSSAVSSAALALYAGYHAWHTTHERRLGTLLFLAMALASLWSSVLLKWLALPVTSAEAFVLAQALHIVRPDIVQMANIVGNPDTHSLILMTRCTTADALPQAAVALVAVALLLGEVNRSRLWQAFAVLLLAYGVANLLRLAGMAWSAEAYALVHGPIGANVFDMFQAALVLALGNWASSAP